MALLLLLQVLSSLLLFANGASSRSTPYLSSNNCMPRLRPIGLSCFVSGSRRRRALCITLANAQDGNQQRQITNVAIVGGGLAGLSTAWHLLELSSNPLRVTIYDKCAVGKGGASAVAGGLVHPFSPKGKLIHFGLEALEKSKHLVHIATKYQPSCLIQPHLYRIALNEANVQQLQDTALKYPQLATWLSREEINTQLGADSMGGLKLSNGCQVIHVPSYLQALWKACENKANEIDGSIIWEKIEMNDDTTVRVLDKNYDALIHAAGAGIVQDNMLENIALPVQLIRGQSILMNLPVESGVSQKNEALLCGKYLTPLPRVDDGSIPQISSSEKQFIIGATHEFKSTKLTQDEVFEELKQRSYSLAPKLWDRGVVQKVTSGMRMQSNRGQYGRMPIIGKIDSLKAGDNETKMWLFAGLSSRGLIYHGLFGNWLAKAVLQNNEQLLSDYFVEFDWWKANGKS